MNDILFDQSSTDDLHRKAGFGLEPLFTWRGLNVYPVFGAEGEGEGGTDPDSKPEGTEDDDAGEEEPKGDSDTVSRADFEKLRAQLSAADKNKSAAEKKLKEIEDGKKDELTKATEKVAELEEARKADQAEIANMRLENAFLTATVGITWHDPADALALAERQGYLTEVVKEDGQVDKAKLASKLKELAKAKPHLVKDSEGKGKDQEEKKPPTGARVGSRGSNGGGTDKDKIPDRYSKHFR
jgi:hypothetical protein